MRILNYKRVFLNVDLFVEEKIYDLINFFYWGGLEELEFWGEFLGFIRIIIYKF